MLAVHNNVETNYKEKIRCGEVYRNLNGNQMFQKFYYRCLECSMDFESGPDFEEHVIVHLLQEDGDTTGENGQSENVIDISSDNDEDIEDNAFLYAVEVTSMGGDEVSECDLPSPIKKMLSQESINLDDENMSFSSDADEDVDTDDQDITFPCKGLRNQALHQYSEPDKCCQLCPAYFGTKLELEQHRMIHTMPGTVECPHCYEVFSSAFKLHQHIRTRRKKAPKLRKNGAKKKCNEANRDSKSQSETSINVETDDDRKSGAKTKTTSAISNDKNLPKSTQGNSAKLIQEPNNCNASTDGSKLVSEPNPMASESGINQSNPSKRSSQQSVAKK